MHAFLGWVHLHGVLPFEAIGIEPGPISARNREAAWVWLTIGLCEYDWQCACACVPRAVHAPSLFPFSLFPRTGRTDGGSLVRVEGGEQGLAFLCARVRSRSYGEWGYRGATRDGRLGQSA